MLHIGSLHLKTGHPVVMGILNITPDSFSDGGELYGDTVQQRTDKALRRAEQMLAEGAAILDLGGVSVRPGADPVPAKEEAERVLPILKAIRREFDAPLSIDTGAASVMMEAASLGADMINDVWALTRPGALEAAAQCQLPVCLMHIQNTPQDMQANPRYGAVIDEVRDWLRQRVDAATQAGIAQEKLLIDPGFGFGKTLAHNLKLLAELSCFSEMGYPLLVGLSRKSMLGTLTGRDNPHERVYGGIAAALCAISQGAAIVRVHDVGATVDALKIWQAVEDTKTP